MQIKVRAGDQAEPRAASSGDLERLFLPAVQPVAAAALPRSSVQSTTRRITSLRLASKAAVTASVESELTGVAFSKRVVATGVRRGMRSKVASSTTVACGVPESIFLYLEFSEV